MNIRLGYVRGVENSRSYKIQMDFMARSNVERMFKEKSVGNISLNELADYMRSGDTVFIYSIDALGKNIRAIIRFIVQTKEKGVALYIKKEKFDSASQLGQYTLNVLEAIDNINNRADLMERVEAPSEKGRIPRELTELRAYMKLVEKGEMTVTEVCSKLRIGRTTYYRRRKFMEENILD